MTKFKKSSRISPLFSEEDIYAMAKEYSEISARMKELGARKKELSEKIKQGAEKFGTKDDKGSYYAENDNFILGKIAKKSFRINQEKAIPMLKERGLGDVIDVVTTEVVNEDSLNSALQKGRISINDVEEFTDVNTDYQVLVKAKDEMPEVEQTKISARKK